MIAKKTSKIGLVSELTGVGSFELGKSVNIKLVQMLFAGFDDKNMFATKGSPVHEALPFEK